ncbi:MAG: hypothetical protein IJJ84_15750 [Kiritimatiellae bacterium]|nr:hypothetical protein [Kiritimatiellia bacterium]
MATRRHKELCSSILLMLAAGTANADVGAWVYDTSRRVVVLPSCVASGETTVEARARGVDVSPTVAANGLYKTTERSNEALVKGTMPNSVIILR